MVIRIHLDAVFVGSLDRAVLENIQNLSRGASLNISFYSLEVSVEILTLFQWLRW